MRKLQDLVDMGLFSKSEDAADRRRVAIHPTDDLIARMQGLAQVANDIGPGDLAAHELPVPDLGTQAP
jgi:DNA-binding MarR family transcriptional regulator